MLFFNGKKIQEQVKKITIPFGSLVVYKVQSVDTGTNDEGEKSSISLSSSNTYYGFVSDVKEDGVWCNSGCYPVPFSNIIYLITDPVAFFETVEKLLGESITCSRSLRDPNDDVDLIKIIEEIKTLILKGPSSD